MKRKLPDYQGPVRATADEGISEGRSSQRNCRHHQKASRPVIGLEERSDRVISGVKRRVIEIASVVFVLCAVIKIGLHEVSDIGRLAGQLTPSASSVQHEPARRNATEPSTVHPEPGRSTVSHHTQEPTEGATNPTASEVATNPTASEVATDVTANEVPTDVKPNSVSTPPTRSRVRKRTSICSGDYEQKTSTVEARSRKLIIEDFKLPLNKVVTFREVNGVVRSRELPSPTAPTSWGNSIVQK